MEIQIVAFAHNSRKPGTGLLDDSARILYPKLTIRRSIRDHRIFEEQNLLRYPYNKATFLTLLRAMRLTVNPFPEYGQVSCLATPNQK